MTSRFDAIILGLIFGATTLSINIPKAGANELKLTQNTYSICRKNSLPQTSSLKHYGKICQPSDNSKKQVSDERLPSDNLDDPTNEEKDDNLSDSSKDTSKTPTPDSNDADRDSSDVNTDDSGYKGASDKSKQKSEPPSTLDSHDFNLIKGNIIFQSSPGSVSGDSSGNGFTFPEPIQIVPMPVKPSPKVLKKTKGSEKLQKLVSPVSNRNRLLPQKIITPINPKSSPKIESLIIPPKGIQPIFHQPDRPLRIRSVQPTMKQHPVINRGISRPIQHRAK
jgi:hypothetical protein